jgi:hypothetical protein
MFAAIFSCAALFSMYKRYAVAPALVIFAEGFSLVVWTQHESFSSTEDPVSSIASRLWAAHS